jgi:NaMN:DMB phosphoribosyltransferase
MTPRHKSFRYVFYGEHVKAITTVAAGVLLALSSQPLMAVGFGRLVNANCWGRLSM